MLADMWKIAVLASLLVTTAPALAAGASDFTLVNYNFLIFGVILAVMMVKRPEGLFPVETAKAEMHGVGISAELTGGGEAELAVAEEEAFEARPELADEGGDPTSAAGAALMADTPPAVIREHDLPEDTR